VIERILSVATGALATFLALVVLNPTDDADPMTTYLTAVIIGAVVSLIWPLAWAFFIGRRAKARRDKSIEEEVQRQMSGQS
jgi:hypothetical protein